MSYLLDNWDKRPGLHKRADNLAGTLFKEVSGLGDLQRGFNSFEQGKLLKGLGQTALGTFNAVTTVVPVVGWGIKAGIGTAKGLFALARGARAVNATRGLTTAQRLAKTKNLSLSAKNAFNAGVDYKAGTKGAEGFTTYMRNNVSYGTPNGKWYSGTNLMRGAKEFMGVGIRSTKQGNAFASGTGSVTGGLATKLGVGANAENITTPLGRWAARHPDASGMITATGANMALGGGYIPEAIENRREGLFDGFNPSGLSAGQYQRPAWLQ